MAATSTVDYVNLPQPATLQALLGNLPMLYLPRTIAGSGVPVKPMLRVAWEPQSCLIVAQTLYDAATSDKGCAMTAKNAAHFAIGLAITTMAMQYGARIPAIPNSMGMRADLMKTAGDLTSFYATGAQKDATIIAAPFGFTRAGAPSEEKSIVKGTRIALRFLRKAPTTPTDGVSYVTEPSIIAAPVPTTPTTEGGGYTTVATIPALPAVLITIAVVGAIGVSQYFKAEVEKKRIYVDAQTSKALAAISAAVQVTLDRQKKEAETGKAIAPSPLETKVADAVQSWTTDKPSGDLAGPIIGLLSGITLTLGIGYAVHRYGTSKK